MFLARKVMHGGGTIPITSKNHPNLIALYTMDSISGSTLVDETTNSNDMTISGATSVSGKIGNALSFEGGDHYAVTTAASPFDLGQGSLCAWVSVEFASTAVMVFSVSDNTKLNDHYNLAVNTDGSVAIFGNQGAGFDYIQFDTSVAIPTSGFGFVCATSDGSTIRVYIQGISVTLTDTAGTNSGHWYDYGIGTQNRASIGALFRSAAQGNLYGGGYVDQLRVFNRALTQAEINELYNGGSGA